MENKRVDNKRYFVYLMGWKGMDFKDVGVTYWDAVFETEEEAIDYVNEAWETVLESDESAYIYHNGELNDC